MQTSTVAAEIGSSTGALWFAAEWKLEDGRLVYRLSRWLDGRYVAQVYCPGAFDQKTSENVTGDTVLVRL